MAKTLKIEKVKEPKREVYKLTTEISVYETSRGASMLKLHGALDRMKMLNSFVIDFTIQPEKKK